MVEERREQLNKAWEELQTRQLSNSQMFDKAILSLSSAGLGFSLAFIKNVVPLDRAAWVWLLYVSWGLFVAATATTLFSFLTSQRGIQKQFAQIGRELAGQDDFQPESNDDAPFKTTERLAYASFGFYMFAVIFTVTFIILNQGGAIMATEETRSVGRKDDDGPKVQRLPDLDKKGAPKVQIPPPPPPPPKPDPPKPSDK